MESDFCEVFSVGGLAGGNLNSARINSKLSPKSSVLLGRGLSMGESSRSRSSVGVVGGVSMLSVDARCAICSPVSDGGGRVRVNTDGGDMVGRRSDNVDSVLGDTSGTSTVLSVTPPSCLPGLINEPFSGGVGMPRKQSLRFKHTQNQ